MKEKRKTFFFLFLLFLPIVFSAPPFTQLSEGSADWELRVALPPAIRPNTDFQFNIHIFNRSNGIPIIENAACYLHLYNTTGKHVYEAFENTPDHTFDYEFNILAANFTREGNYVYELQCNSSNQGGFFGSYLIVNDEATSFDHVINSTESTGLNVFIIFLTMALVFLILAHVFKDQHHSAFLYGVISATISYLLFAMMIGGMRVVKNITMIVDVNYYIGLLVLGLGIYATVIGNVFYQEKKRKMTEDND